MAAPTLQQIKTNRTSTTVTSLAVTFDSAPATNALIVVFAASSVNPSGMSISDAGGNTYTQRTSYGYADIWGRIYTAPAASNPGAITVSQSSGYCSIVAVEVRGYAAGTVFEKVGNFWQGITSSNSPYSPLNFTATTNAEQLFLATLFGNRAANVTWTAGSGWTTSDQYASLTEITHSLISRAVTSTGTYDPEWTGGGGSQNGYTMGISIVAGSSGNPAGNNDLAGSATAGATASATLAVQRNLAAAAVAGALASGTLSINRALTGAAIGAALGSATLTAFSSVWRIPTNAPNGTAVHATVFSGASPTYAILAQGTAIVAGGFVDIPGIGSIGAKAFAFVHNYSDNTATTNIRGGPAIAALTSL